MFRTSSTRGPYGRWRWIIAGGALVAVGILALAEVGQFLEGNGRTHVYAGYWDAYIPAVATNERVTASPTAAGLNRVPSYTELAARARRSTYVFQAGGPLDKQMRRWLAAHPVGHRYVVRGYALYLLDRQVTPQSLPLFGIT